MSICGTRGADFPKPIREPHHDDAVPFNAVGTAASAPVDTPTMVGGNNAGATDGLALVLWPAFQACGGTARLQRELLYQFCHARHRSHERAIWWRVERYGYSV